ncbi:MAG TPA: hypothetical protein VFR81_13955 [Longimicrobium sp.]|nr:hypothetical protein [Longimicrobium sp.]
MDPMTTLKPLNIDSLIVETFVTDASYDGGDDNTRTRTQPLLSCYLDCSYDGKGCEAI